MGRKPNQFLARMQAEKDAACRMQRLFTIQQCKDMMLIAAHEMGFGAERLKRLGDIYDAVFVEYAEMAVRDGRDDPGIDYTKAKLDGKLKEILGEHFTPWDERYLI